MEANGLYCKYWSEQVGRSHSPAFEAKVEETAISNKEIVTAENVGNNDNSVFEPNTGTTDSDDTLNKTRSNNPMLVGFEDEIEDDEGGEGESGAIEVETSSVKGDKTPPRTPKSVNTQFREKFIRLQNKYEIYIHGAKHGDANALEEIDRVFRDLNFLFTRIGNDIDRGEAFDALSREKVELLSMSEPRARHSNR